MRARKWNLRGIVGTVSLCDTDFPKLRIRESHLSPERGFSGVSAP